MRSIFVLLIFSALLLASNNPLQTATAGAYHTRAIGNHALGSNPANLGHYGEVLILGRSKIDSLAIEIPDSLALLYNDGNAVVTDSTKYYYSVQLVAIPDRKLVKKVLKGYQSQFGRDLPTAIIAEESLYKFRVGDFTSRDSVNVLRDSIISAGYKDAWVVTSGDPLPLSEEITPYFTMTIAGLRSDIGNNALYPDWIIISCLVVLICGNRPRKMIFCLYSPLQDWISISKVVAVGWMLVWAILQFPLSRSKHLLALTCPLKLWM